MSTLRVKRIYDPALPSDGLRVLVDRLWPRGVSKAAAALNFWLKEIAPSAQLREWFGHDPARFDAFATRYRSELKTNGEVVDYLRGIAKVSDTTLLYAAHNAHVNHAVVLAEFLAGQGLHFERDS